MKSDSPLVILAPRMTNDSTSVWRECISRGWPTERAQGWRVPEHIRDLDRDVIIYGEPLFAEAVADQLDLVLLEPNVDWLTSLPFEYTLRKIEIMTLGEARVIENAAFVKPADGKIFDPKVYAKGGDLPSDESVDLDVLVLRSGIVDFRLEVRCFVKGNSILSMSPYWRDDELAQDKHEDWPFLDGEESYARAFAESVIADERVPLPPGCTLDVGLLNTGDWAVIEANPCWGAGLYACDPGSVLDTIRTSVIPKKSLLDSQIQWVSKRRSGVHEDDK